MIPPPSVIGLVVCEKAIIEESTRNVSLLNTFARLRLDNFPSPPVSFTMYAALLDGRGQGTIHVVVSDSETDDRLYVRERTVTFPDPLTEMHLLFRIQVRSFPAPGIYRVTLLVDGELLAHRYFNVTASEGTS